MSRTTLTNFISCLVFLLFVTQQKSLLAQNVQATGQQTVSGVIAAIKPGELTIKDSEGNLHVCKIQDKRARGLTINGMLFNAPAKISVTGSIPAKLAEKGMIFKFKGTTNVYGRSKNPLKEITLGDNKVNNELRVEFLERKEDKKEECQVEVTGRVLNFAGNKVRLEVEEAKWARGGRIEFLCADDCVLQVNDDHVRRIRPNDIVKQANFMTFESGENVIRSIDIFLAAERDIFTTSFHERLEQEYSHLSDAPGEPRELRSKYFIVQTDISDRNAGVLLAKLDTMVELVGGYYGARTKQPILCYVVRDLRKWDQSQLDPKGIAKIVEPAGVTIYQTNNRGVTNAVVYSCDNHAIVQHEAVHAFCAQMFGSTGPVWYAEGMAEMGQYWKPGETGVDIDPVVIEFLTRSEPKRMIDIVAAGQITGDSWQAYAWRWALCHMLANNSNYSRRFKVLGLNLMTKKKTDSFDKAFGRQADQISFEYDQFVQNFGNGYRMDLCHWDWKSKPANLASTGRIKKEILAARGWQGTKLLARPGVTYEFAATNQWKTTTVTDACDADGDSTGNGKLIGAIFKDFELGEPFEMGKRGTFTVEEEGHLFVRCRDDWTSLGDNSDSVNLHIRRLPKSESK